MKITTSAPAPQYDKTLHDVEAPSVVLGAMGNFFEGRALYVYGQGAIDLQDGEHIPVSKFREVNIVEQPTGTTFTITL